MVAALSVALLTGCSAEPDDPPTPTTRMAGVQDRPGDALAGSDLADVKVTATDKHLVVYWKLTDTAPKRGDAGYYLNFISSDGRHSGQLGVTYQDGAHASQFVVLDGTTTVAPPTAKTGGKTARATFERSLVQPLSGRSTGTRSSRSMEGTVTRHRTPARTR